MLHLYFKWRYERKARSGAFTLPRSGRGEKLENANLSSYLSHTSGPGHSLRPYDLPRKRRKLMRWAATILVIALISWVAYESVIALAMLGR